MRIAVIIPAHDAAPWIADAVGSVIGQTYRAWSLVVVDDGSTDATASVVRPFLADSRVALLRQDRAGVSIARNRGMAASADADALLFLDADDWLAADALARLSAALAGAPAAVAASGPAGFVSPDATPGTPAARRLRGVSGDLVTALLERNLFANAGQVLIRADAARADGGFRPRLAYGEDWEFMIRAALRGPFVRAASAAPVVFVRRRLDGAYLCQATQAAAFADCMSAVFGNPALRARLGADRLDRLRARAERENDWVIGRALLAHGRRAEGCAALRRSLAAKPSLKRAALTLALHLGGGFAA